MRSRVFYSRVKGEAEDAVAKVGIECVSIFRPSLILGPRDEVPIEGARCEVGSDRIVVRHGRVAHEVSAYRGNDDCAGNARHGHRASSRRQGV